MGAATALYSATCYSLGKYGNGNLYPVNLRAVVGLSGWLPGSRYEVIQYIPSQAKLIYAAPLIQFRIILCKWMVQNNIITEVFVTYSVILMRIFTARAQCSLSFAFLNHI